VGRKQVLRERGGDGANYCRLAALYMAPSFPGIVMNGGILKCMRLEHVARRYCNAESVVTQQECDRAASRKIVAYSCKAR